MNEKGFLAIRHTLVEVREDWEVEDLGLTTAAYRISCAVRLLRLPTKSISLYFCATVSEGAADCCGKGCWHNNFGITQSCPVEWR